MAPSVVSMISRRGAAGVSTWICGRGGRSVSRISTLSDASDESIRSPSSLPSKISPWLMLPPAVEGGDVVHKFYSLADNRVLSLNNNKRAGGDGEGEEGELGFPDDYTRLVGSSHGWLALLNMRNRDVFLMNPLSRRHVKLPPVGDNLPIPDECLRTPFELVSEVIISCSPEEKDNCRAMMICGPANNLAFCCPGRSTEWTPIGDLCIKDTFIPRCYNSCVYSAAEKRFFCVTNDHEFEAWDLRDPHSPRKIPLDVSPCSETYPTGGRSKEESLRNAMCMPADSLVVNEKSGELFMVTRFIADYVDSNGDFISPDLCFSETEGYDRSMPHKTLDFDVYKYDPESREFKYMDRSLDGLAFFIGTNHSFAISASEFPELKPNAIYYTDVLGNRYDSDEVNYGGHDIGIFSYEDRTISPCYYPCDAKSIKRISPCPIWYTPSPL